MIFVKLFWVNTVKKAVYNKEKVLRNWRFYELFIILRSPAARNQSTAYPHHGKLENARGESLVGVYLHGSVALGAFQPASGDLDVLVVVKDALTIETKLKIAQDLLEIDGSPCPVELSAVKLCDVQPWRTPGNCVFHYSDFWSERIEQRLHDPDFNCYVLDREFPDADVTSYIKLILQCGVTLYGPPSKEIFSEISDEDFWQGISADVRKLRFS